MIVLKSLTVALFLIKIIIILFIVQQKMSRYSKWQQHTKSQDIGILTLFHLQQIHGQNDSKITIDYDRSVKLQAPSVVKRIRKREHKWLSELESGLCNKIGTYGSQPQMAKQPKGRHQKNAWIHSEPKQEKVHKLRMEGMSSIETGSKNRKTSLKLQYYDVAHMSIVLNSRPIKNKLYSKLKTTNEEPEKKSENIQRRSESLGNRKSQLYVKCKKKESYRQVYTKSLKELLASSHQNSLSANKLSQQVLNPDNQRVINLDKFKLRRQKFNFREIFKKKLKITSERDLLRVLNQPGSRLKTLEYEARQKKPRFLKPIKNVNLICVSSKLIEQIGSNQISSIQSIGTEGQKGGDSLL